MPSLKEIKNRVASVNSTLKITSAMKMVAAAKLHKAQTAIGNMLPYQEMLYGMLGKLMTYRQAAMVGEEPLEKSQDEFQDEEKEPTVQEELDILYSSRPVHKVAIVAYSSNSSLCGGFNSSAIKHVTAIIDEYLASGLSAEDITVFSVGRKMADAMKKKGFVSPADYTHLADKPGYEEASKLATELVHGFMTRRFDKVELSYNHFRSTASQPPVRETYLPFAPVNDTEKTGNAESFDYIVEPDVDTILEELLPKVLMLKMYTVQLDTNAAEHAARTLAMQTATDNGNEILQELTLEYNKGRQQKITSEIIDLVGGSMQ